MGRQFSVMWLVSILHLIKPELMEQIFSVIGPSMTLNVFPVYF